MCIRDRIHTYYTTGLPVLHSAPNPILAALANQYPYMGLIRRRGENTVVHWNVFKSAEDLCWAADLSLIHISGQ